MENQNQNQNILETETHIPVMLVEVTENLKLRAGCIAVDATLGLGGHAVKMLERIAPGGIFVGIDRDTEALKVAQQRIQSTGATIILRQSDYRNLDSILSDAGIGAVDAILLDLGVSSLQLDDASRGFSLRHDGPLDMRMDKESYISAYDLVNNLSERELSAIIKNFGEERWHNRIARHLVKERVQKPIESTQELCESIVRAIPPQYRRGKIHPATRTFQAIRIAVNRELESLEVVLEKSIGFLKKGGRLVVISFHSLEDRIVKDKFRRFGSDGSGTIIYKKPLLPTEEEVNYNPRSRSAKMRVLEKN